MNTQFEPYTRDTCIKTCNTDHNFNPTLSCGIKKGEGIPSVGLRTPIQALISGEPGMAKCINDLNNQQKICLEKCDYIKKNGVNASPELMNKLKEQYLPNKQPFQINNINNSNNVNNTNINIELNILNNIGGTLEHVFGNTITTKIVNIFSTKYTPSELNILTPKILTYFQSTDKINQLNNNTLTLDQILSDISNKKHMDVYLDGSWLHQNKIHWGFAIKWKRKRWGWHVCLDQSILNIGGGGGAHETQLEEFCKNPHHLYADMKNYFAGHCSIPVSYIHEIIPPPYGRGEGSLNPIGHRWRVVWSKYKFTVVLKEGCNFDYLNHNINKTDDIVINNEYKQNLQKKMLEMNYPKDQLPSSYDYDKNIFNNSYKIDLLVKYNTEWKHDIVKVFKISLPGWSGDIFYFSNFSPFTWTNETGDRCIWRDNDFPYGEDARYYIGKTIGTKDSDWIKYGYMNSNNISNRWCYQGNMWCNATIEILYKKI